MTDSAAANHVEAVLRSYVAAGDSGNYSEMSRWLDEGVVAHSPGGVTIEGIEAHVASWAAAHAGLAGLRHEVQEVVAREQVAVARVVVTGTHRGTFLGIPATGRTVRVDQALFVHVDDDRIVELWEVVDTGTGLQQLGALSGQVLSPGG